MKLTPKHIVFAALVLIETAIYIAFNVISARQPYDPIYLKYAGVLLCFAVSAVMIYFNRDADAVINTAAMLFTVISDLFILVLDRHYEIGLVTFTAAHSIYLYRLYYGRVKRIWITLAVRAAVAATIIGVCCGLFGANLLLVEASIYIVMLVGNAIEALIMCNRGIKNVLFAIGLMLFVGCDICVGLDHGRMIGVNIAANVGRFIQFMIWVFYLPSQVLIALSLIKKGPCYKANSNELQIQKTD